MSDRRRAIGRALAAAAIAVITFGTATVQGASLFDPALRFRVVRTPHFRIYFHQGADHLAARLTAIAEDVWQQLERPLGVRPPALTHVVIADQTELPNAYATPLPYDTIVIFPTWPTGSEFDVDDWLRLVFTHEFTHIVHLDRSESWARVLRGAFGRMPIAFPNLFLPTWQVEGLATYEESALTGEGRLHAGEFRALVDEAARRGRLQPLDRVNGGLTDWPGGQAPYAYGSAFHQYLAERFGTETLGQLAEATARRVPYTASRVFPRIFGESLDDLWRDFEAAYTSSAGAPRFDDAATRLTRHGFVAAAPRFDRSSSGADASLVYSKRTPDGFPSLERIGIDGGAAAQLATRYLGSSTAVGSNAIYFDQLEYQRNVALTGDLYRLSRENGGVSRITAGARLHDPDLSPDETTIAAVQEKTGRRDLVLVRLKADTTTDTPPPVKSAVRRTLAIETLLSEPETQFNNPRWSPDGKTVAVERHRLGSDPQIVAVDIASHTTRVVAAHRGTRIVMPTWRSNGRAIVAAVAADDQPFNLVEFPVDGDGAPRQLTHTSGGATWPEVSADGRTLVFVGYTVDGYDVFSMPYPADASAGTALTVQTSLDEPLSGQRPPLAGVSTYSPLPTLKPTSWSPIVEWDTDQVRVGAATSGYDVLGYHAYSAEATWLASGPSGAATPARGNPDWFVAYAYDRWRPTLFASAASTTTFFAGPATPAGTPSSASRRERDVEGGIILPIIRARHSHAALATLFRATDDYTLPDRSFSRERTAVRAAWRTITAKSYGYSISPEDGIVAGTTAEFVRAALGASADATTFTVDIRGFLPGFAPHHVVAARASGGVSSGDPIVGRTFVLGGAAPDPNVIDFGSGAVSLLRGFESNSFAGSRVALVNGEYRWPIARPQRGVGTWPLFLHTIHAAVFVDAGHAWTRTFRASAIKTSVGGEFTANVVAGFYFPFTATVGVARGHDGSGTLPDATIVYFRVGKSF